MNSVPARWRGKKNSIVIHRTLVELKPVDKFIITCKALSRLKISICYNTLASRTSLNDYLIGSTLVSDTDLENVTAANEKVRPMLRSEQLLGAFNIYGDTLQCLKAVEFS